jgi:hypothetical protein
MPWKHKMKPYLLGIDGGGSSTHFLLTNLDEKPIMKKSIPRGSNPWSCGVDQTLEVLSEGMAHFEFLQPGIVQCIAGMSGCYTASSVRSRLTRFLQRYVRRTEVIGDLATSFRAATSSKTGILAIAGSGSSAVQFFEDASYVYDGVAVGGRDLGFMLARAYERGDIPGVTARRFLERVAPVLTESKLKKTEDYYHNAQLRSLAEPLSVFGPTSRITKDLHIWLDAAADRWQYKLYGIVAKYLAKEPNAPTPLTLVLSGNFWELGYIRTRVTDALVREYPQLDIIHAPAIPPVAGAIKLAHEAYLATLG